ncbi:MAG: uracil-DNA glycosylase [Bellilinea sp.]
MSLEEIYKPESPLHGGDSIGFDPARQWAELNERIEACRLCPRLVSWREEVARVKKRAFRDWDYWGKPVPGFGDPDARLLVVGLAPGAHGSNRTGRMFTGDSSGDFLYAALYRVGMANQPMTTHCDDGLALKDVFITAICRCVPPDNKPTPQEIRNCQPFLEAEMKLLTRYQGIVALGSLAFQQVQSMFRGNGHTLERLEFKHNALFTPGGGLPWIITSYHPSRQNTQTGRLTSEMFDAVWQRAKRLLDGLGN